MCENSISDDTFIYTFGWCIRFYCLMVLLTQIFSCNSTGWANERCACMRDSDFVTHMPKKELRATNVCMFVYVSLCVRVLSQMFSLTGVLMAIV